jgi:cytochrome c peroxidase
VRKLMYTAPYMPNGSEKTLPEAVRVMGETQLNRTLTGEQVRDITAFLAALTGPFPVQTMPRLPPTPGALLGRWARRANEGASCERLSHLRCGGRGDLI